MKKLVLISLLFSVSVLADSFKSSPFVYVGKVKYNDGTKGDVTLELGSRTPSGESVFVRTFRIGDFDQSYSGTIRGNSLVFNSNDDYIPGGNASYNVTTVLNFKNKSAVGTIHFYDYPNHDGYGGANQADGELRYSGSIKLKRKKIKVTIE